MRRLALICTLLAAGTLAIAGTALGGDGGPYEIRAVFDSGSFLVPGEDVRIAGARIGSVQAVEVSMPGEIDSLSGGSKAIPGKAVVVIAIDDPAFQDFRADASCIVRPQSLLGERYVECKPTQARAPGTEPPPPLEPVADGQPGAGQLLLPLENNGNTVDLDLVQNIQRLPYAQRFTLILNELGAGLAARGPELASIVERADPALRETDRVLAILAKQNHTLAQLASDSNAILAPLAAQREHVSGFINHAGAVAEASAERGAALREGLAKLPRTLDELRPTMRELERFSDAATPVVATLGAAAPALTRATEALGPFAHHATPALISLGDAAVVAGPDLVAADPIVQDLTGLALNSRPATIGLRDLTRSLDRTGGYQQLMKFLFYSVGATNGYDNYGHFLRALLIVTNCNDYELRPIGGCEANFSTQFTSAASSASNRRVGTALTNFLFGGAR